MKKVSVQFNLEVPLDESHKEVERGLRTLIEENDFGWGKITSIQINNTEKRGKR